MLDNADISVPPIGVCLLSIKVVGVSDGPFFTHHLVCVGAGAIGVGLAVGDSDAFLRRDILLAMENKTLTKSRLNKEMITIL